MAGITGAVKSFFAIDRGIVAWVVVAGIGYWLYTKAKSAPVTTSNDTPV